MAVSFNCPSCKATYEVADDLAGKMIMCRVCKKRGPVRSLGAAGSSATLAAAGSSMAATPSRRNFLPIAGLFLASLGAIGVGALLARQPWDRSDPRDDWKGGPGGRRRGPGGGEDKKDGKEGAV
ncbi:MAG TPA: hypothetical protein VH592_03790 [Gemmataceae bacterium]|jgi:hypothetical protein